MKEEKPKLLVVDDEPDQCESIENYFSRRNFTVFTASCGIDALAIIKENKPDVVLLDMKLSGSMDGSDVLRELRKNDKETKVIMVTGDLVSEQKLQEVTELGIVEFLLKPIDVLTLESSIKKTLEHNYPDSMHVEATKPKMQLLDFSLRRISHELSNITSDITNKCELYILDTEEGLNKDKSEKERLDEAVNILKSILKSTEKLAELVKKLSSLAKR